MLRKQRFETCNDRDHSMDQDKMLKAWVPPEIASLRSSYLKSERGIMVWVGTGFGTVSKCQ